MITQHDMTLRFIASNGFDVTSDTDLYKALEWVKNSSGDNLVWGEPTGDPFDMALGELRRPMLIDALNTELQKLNN